METEMLFKELCCILAAPFFVSNGLGANGLTALDLAFQYIVLFMEAV